MKKISSEIRYTSQSAWDYAKKKLDQVSFTEAERLASKKTWTPRLKIVIKVFEMEE